MMTKSVMTNQNEKRRFETMQNQGKELINELKRRISGFCACCAVRGDASGINITVSNVSLRSL
jgi:hypothetical protein